MALAGSNYWIVYGLLVCVVSITSLSLFVTSFFLIPQKKDTARRGFIWLKIALILVFLGAMLCTIRSIIGLLLWYRMLDDRSLVYSEILDRLWTWASFLIDLSSVSTLLSLVDVALGIIYCWDRMRRARPILQRVTYVFGLGLAAFFFTAFVKKENFAAQSWGFYKEGALNYIPDSRDLRPFELLAAAAVILLFVAHLVQLALSLFVIVVSRKELEHRRTALLLLLASIFAFIRAVWYLAISAAWAIPQKSPEGTYFIILSAVLDFTFLLISFIFTFWVGVKKSGGLWSTSQYFDPFVQE